MGDADHGDRFDPGWLPGLRVPFRWDAFAAKYRLLFEQPDRSGLAVALQAAARLGLLGALQAGWAADELVARRWRGASLRGPIFILGHQRSGTTFLHRLLVTDRRIAGLALHEMLLPATTIQAALGVVAAADRRGGGLLRRGFDALQERLFGELDPIHRIRFDAVEEDEFVLWTLFASVMAVNDAPSAAVAPDFDVLRDFERWRPRHQTEALGWYRACLLKKAARVRRRLGAAPWIVSKNPAFTHKVGALRRAFPDATFVFLHRDPLAAIPSRLSLIRAIWRRRVRGFSELTPAQVEAIVADSVRTCRAAARWARELPTDRAIVIPFEALRADPDGQVRAVLERAGLGPPDATLAAFLEALGPRPPSTHRYDLRAFGLDADALRERLGPPPPFGT